MGRQSGRALDNRRQARANDRALQAHVGADDDDEGHHWYLPKPSLVAKLGQPNGPDIAWVRRAAELRRALKGDYGFEIEDPEREPPKIEAQSRGSPPPVLKDGLPPPEQAPPPEQRRRPIATTVPTTKSRFRQAKRLRAARPRFRRPAISIFRWRGRSCWKIESA